MAIYFSLERPWSGLLVRCVLAFDKVLGLISTQSITPFVAVPVLFALFLVIAVHCNG